MPLHYSPARCTLCPRRCGADRTKGRGLCGGADVLRAARAALHLWEEPPLCGEHGAGTVFFSGCPLHCRFCQNAVISEKPYGKDISRERLGEIFLELQEQGASCIELVTAGHFVPYLLPVLEQTRPALHIPVVYNSGGYELPEALAALEGLVDIYLPDLKFYDAQTARDYAHAPDYPEVAAAALHEMLRQTGSPIFEGERMIRGVILRHLVLPGHRHESIALLRFLAERFGTGAFLLSLMAQYTPMRVDADFPELNRKITKMEYQSVLREAQALGFAGFSQDKTSAEQSYTPDFGMQGL